MNTFNGRVAVITGGASGIGLAAAKRLAKEGANIVLADIEQVALDRAVEEVKALGVDVIGVPTDVGELQSVTRLADETEARFGGTDLLFNNAGVAGYGAIQDMSHQDWEWIIRVDLWGVIHGVEVFLPRMIERGENAHIINTASFAGLVPNKKLGAYCVAKYGVVGLSECLARDVKSYGIGVSVLCPMIVHTNIEDSSRNRPDALGGPGRSLELSDDERAKMQGRALDVENVAEQVIEGIRDNKLYIITHDEAREFIKRRFERIDESFDF